MSSFAFDHVHIYCENVEETVTFYKSVFGAEEIRRVQAGAATLVHLRMGQGRIVISRGSETNPTGLGHFALSTDNLDEAIARLKELGYTMTDIRQAGAFTNVFMRDPAGVSVEIMSPSTE
ncbi:MAG: VOC family protein [Paenibacillaceae bacterium]|nr:VOC family protein [Paenibacillaceae bacterium]